MGWMSSVGSTTLGGGDERARAGIYFILKNGIFIVVKLKSFYGERKAIALAAAALHSWLLLWCTLRGKSQEEMHLWTLSDTSRVNDWYRRMTPSFQYRWQAKCRKCCLLWPSLAWLFLSTALCVLISTYTRYVWWPQNRRGEITICTSSTRTRFC